MPEGTRPAESETGPMRKMLAERTANPCHSAREGFTYAERRSWGCEGANEENTADATRTSFASRHVTWQRVMSGGRHLSRRRGLGEAKVAGGRDVSRDLAMQYAVRVAYRVRHRPN